MNFDRTNASWGAPKASPPQAAPNDPPKVAELAAPDGDSRDPKTLAEATRREPVGAANRPELRPPTPRAGQAKRADPAGRQAEGGPSLGHGQSDNDLAWDQLHRTVFPSHVWRQLDFRSLLRMSRTSRTVWRELLDRPALAVAIASKELGFPLRLDLSGRPLLSRLGEVFAARAALRDPTTALVYRPTPLPSGLPFHGGSMVAPGGQRFLLANDAHGKEWRVEDLVGTNATTRTLAWPGGACPTMLTRAQFAPDGRQVAAWGVDGALSVMLLLADLVTGQTAAITRQAATFRGAKSELISLASRAASNGEGRETAIETRDWRNGSDPQEVGSVEGEFDVVAASPTGNRLALASADKILLWDWDTKKELRAIDKRPYLYRYANLVFSPDDAFLLGRFSTDANLLVTQLATSDHTLVNGNIACISPDSRTVAVYDSWENTIKIIDRVTSSMLKSVALGPDTALSSLAYSQEGDTLRAVDCGRHRVLTLGFAQNSAQR